MKSVNLGLKVMKRLFAVFLVLGALMSVEAWGADNNKVETPVEQFQKDQSYIAQAYNYLMSFAKSMCNDIISGAYSSISSIFNNVVSILLAMIAVFWLFKHIKTGTISREEVYKALMWVIVFVIVYVLLNSKTAYEEFAKIFLIPQGIVKAALTSSFGVGSNVGEVLNYSFVRPVMILFEIVPNIFNAILDDYSWWEVVAGVIVSIFITSGLGTFYLIYLLFNLIVVISITIINLYSYFLSAIYLIFLPIMIPLLLLPQTKSIFFTWVKSFIAITMYIPLSMIPLGIINKMSKVIVENSGTVFLHKLAFLTILGIISCIIAIIVLTKIPTWINELLGVANQGVGMGGALGMLKTAGMALGSAGMGAIPAMAKSMSSSVANLKSGSSIGSKIGSIANLGHLGGYGTGSSVAKAGFNAIGQHYARRASKLFKGED